MALLDDLNKHFTLKHNSGWTAIDSRIVYGYGTPRIAKLLRDGELQFTIGATKRGQELNLDPTIRKLSEGCGFNVQERCSTSGSGPDTKIYPAIDTTQATDLVIRVLMLVEGAAMHGVISDDA